MTYTTWQGFRVCPFSGNDIDSLSCLVAVYHGFIWFYFYTIISPGWHVHRRRHWEQHRPGTLGGP